MAGLHGTVGLGPIGTGPSFVDRMATMNLIDKKIMSFSINYHNSTSKEEAVSYLTFGGVEPEDY